jgi:UDP-N-acetyl-2-amino-2-deoxyglucuronate dehydrogenase
MKAIRDTGNDLFAALDKYDGVGIIDSYFPNAEFFLEPERFDRYLDKLRRRGENKIDYVSICSPNYLHDSHIRLALRNDAHAICEKPIVLNPWNVEALKEIERETGKTISTILQLRLHPSIVEFRERIAARPKEKRFHLDLVYITSRGKWYNSSWKADNSKSGGVATNIGIHFFDMLTWIFGKETNSVIHLQEPNKAAGLLTLERADIRWFLSIDANDLPKEVKKTDKKTFRSITSEEGQIEFSDGFTDLHTLSYQQILKGNCFSLDDAYESVKIAHAIRNATAIGKKGDYHPILKDILP